MADVLLMPYTRIVRQEQLKLALEVAYIAGIGGVLIRGQRGTGKSTAARAFARMIYGKLPVTLPINATEDRVVGGWNLEELLKAESEKLWRPGLLQQADKGLLFIDEVNLLDDHIVNIILDVSSTGVLTIQRDDRDEVGIPISFSLVGTMNPDEGELRPQLLDRFGLAVYLVVEENPEDRLKIVDAVLEFDAARKTGKTHAFFVDGANKDAALKRRLDYAQRVFAALEFPRPLLKKCIAITADLKVHGHRADILLPLAAKAAAAREYVATLSDAEVAAGKYSGAPVAITEAHVQAVAPLVLIHRRHDQDKVVWDTVIADHVTKMLG